MITRHRVLVVDDDADRIATLSKLVAHLGHHVRVVGSESLDDGLAVTDADLILVELDLGRSRLANALPRSDRHRLCVVGISERGGSATSPFDYVVAWPLRFEILRQVLWRFEVRRTCRVGSRFALTNSSTQSGAELMAQLIQDIMSKQVHSVTSNVSLLDVARVMRDKKIGDVLVTHRDGTLRGIVTDRDIVVRADASNKPLDRTQVGEICTDQLVKLEPTSTIDEAIEIMRQHAIRRIPVVSNGQPVGIVTIGDLARHQDPRSALADISSAMPNN
jgi:CBS domain-containing protein